MKLNFIDCEGFCNHIFFLRKMRGDKMDISLKIAIGTIIVLSLIIIKGVLDNRKYKKNLYARLKNTFGQPSREEYSEELMQKISYYFRAVTKEGDIDDITCNDIDLDKIYQRLNCTRTSIGEEYLYALLRRPSLDVDELDERERVIQIMSDNEEERIQLQTALEKIGKVRSLSVYENFESVDDMNSQSKIYHILCALALLVSGALCFVTPAMAAILAVVVVFNVITYFQKKVLLDSYVQLFSFVIRLSENAIDIAKIKIPGIEEYQKKLITSARKLKKLGKNSWLISGATLSGDLLDSLMDYVRMLFHVDLIKLCSMVSEIKKYKKELAAVYEIIGFIDSMISIAAYRYSLEAWCIPEFDLTGDRYRMEVSEIYHPLIDEPVKNSIDVDSCVLLTGSNASGKSTFIRTIAINAIFAQTIHTVLADNYRARLFYIYSSMALRDDIFSSESYYMVEIKSLKRIIDMVQKSEADILCCIDEVLRGTNTLERIASSAQVLKSLCDMGATCFAATHDIELTRILKQYYENYHFEEQVCDNDVHFDYKLRDGNAKTRNAIKLLNMIGYDKKIVEDAEGMVQAFLDTGMWSL